MKVYDGEVEVFVHDSSSLSKLVAEQEAGWELNGPRRPQMLLSRFKTADGEG